MLEEISANFQKLIALYETEKQRADALSDQYAQAQEKIVEYKKQITDLNQQIDNLKLQCAFGASGDNFAAKESITRLIREIDKCIKLLEK